MNSIGLQSYIKIQKFKNKKNNKIRMVKILNGL